MSKLFLMAVVAALLGMVLNHDMVFGSVKLLGLFMGVITTFVFLVFAFFIIFYLANEAWLILANG